MIVQVRKDAPKIFWGEFNRRTRPDAPVPKTYDDFGKEFEKIKGKKFKVVDSYDNRVVLAYKKPRYETSKLPPYNKIKIIGIDMDKKLVKVI